MRIAKASAMVLACGLALGRISIPASAATVTIVPSTGTTAGPTTSATGNQNNTGVFPLLCDGCAVSISPPQPPTFPNCPKPNPTQCHGGTQFDPKPPCQLSQPTGANYTVTRESIALDTLKAPLVVYFRHANRREDTFTRDLGDDPPDGYPAGRGGGET